MKVKDLKVGDIFRIYDNCSKFRKEKDNKISSEQWHQGVLGFYGAVHHLFDDNKDVILVNEKFNLIEALQRMQQGKKVRSIKWPTHWWSTIKNREFIREDGVAVFFDEIDGLEEDMWEEYEELDLVEIKLNDEYSAQINSDGIHVGCQSFTFEQLDQVVKASKKFRE